MKKVLGFLVVLATVISFTGLSSCSKDKDKSDDVETLKGTVWEHRDGEDFEILTFMSSSDLKIETSFEEDLVYTTYTYNPPIVRVKEEEEGRGDMVLEVSGDKMTYIEIYDGEKNEVVFTRTK